MKSALSATKMSGGQRRTTIIDTARRLFVEKGFDKTTTRQLADAAGVSEALVFKHFPTKEALYHAIQMSCFQEQGAKTLERLHAVEPSHRGAGGAGPRLRGPRPGTGAGRGGAGVPPPRAPQPDGRRGICAACRSGGAEPLDPKFEECIEAAHAAGDMVIRPFEKNLGGWCVHQLVVGVLVHYLPADPVIDYGASREELVKQVVWFCLRGIGLTDQAIGRCREAIP